MADTAYPGTKAPRRKRSSKSGLNAAPDGSVVFDDAKRVSMACVACRKRCVSSLSLLWPLYSVQGALCGLGATSSAKAQGPRS